MSTMTMSQTQRVRILARLHYPSCSSQQPHANVSVISGAAYRDASCDTDTNAAAIAAIEFAIESAEVLNLSVDPLWQHTASRLHIPFDARHNIHPEFVGELLW